MGLRSSGASAEAAMIDDAAGQDAGSGLPSTDRAKARLSCLSIFSERDYLTFNPDVAQAGLDGLRHALTHGVHEGRRIFSDAALARAYGGVARRDSTDAAVASADRMGPNEPEPRCSVFVHSLSDAAYHEAAAALADDLATVGFATTLRDESADRLADHGTAVFVAAHEFFRLGTGQLWAEPAILGEGFVLMDDPVESVEGGQSLAAILDARGVIETSAVGTTIWSDAGIPTLHVLPRVRLRNRWLEPADLGHPLMLAAPLRARSLTCDPFAWNGRPLDVLFFGKDSPRRNGFFGRHAASLAEHECFIYTQQGVVGKAEERLHRRAHTRISGHLSTQARITLNLCEGRFPALERRRVLDQAMAGGSVVVSDGRFVEPVLRPGVHYLYEDANHLGSLIAWLLNDPDGQHTAERVREQAFGLIAAINRDPSRLARLPAFLMADAEGRGTS